jgi:twinkle protein
MTKRIPCPSCIDRGKDKSGDNLNVSSMGNGKCFACNAKYTKREVDVLLGTIIEKDKPTVISAGVDTVAAYPLATSSARGISDKVHAEAGVRESHSEATGKVDRTMYPYYNNEGEEVACKVRILETKDFYWVGSPKKVGLFGKSTLSGKYATLVLVEGEEDKLAVDEMMRKRPTKPDVLSLPNGSSLDDATKSEIELFSKYKRIIICCDADDPGKAVSRELADWLSPLSNVEVVTLKGHKDASDYLTSGEASKFIKEVYNGEKFVPEGIVCGDDIELDDLLEPMEEGLTLPYSGLQEKLHGLRKGEIVTVCAASGIGKSTLVRELSYHLNIEGHSVANVSLEDQMRTAAQALLAMDMGIPLPIFRMSPPPKSEVQTHHDRVIANGRTHFFKHFGSLNSDVLLNKLWYYARASKVDFIILDHLSIAISGNKSTDERKDLDVLMTRLAELVVQTGVGLINVVHLKRKNVSKGKSLNEGGRVELTDLRGSAAIEQLSWAVIAMERNQQDDEGLADVSTLRVLKNRTWGFTGEAGLVKFNHDNGRLVEFDGGFT